MTDQKKRSVRTLKVVLKDPARIVKVGVHPDIDQSLCFSFHTIHEKPTRLRLSLEAFVVAAAMVERCTGLTLSEEIDLVNKALEPGTAARITRKKNRLNAAEETSC